MARILRQQRGCRRGGAGERLVMEAPPLLVDPDVAGSAAEDETAPPARVAVVGRGVDIEPDISEMGEIASRLADQRVAGAGRVGAGALHDPVLGEIGSDLQDHVEVGVETARRDEDGPAIHFDRVAAPDIPAFEAHRPAVVDADAGDLRVGHDLAAARAIGLDQPGGEFVARAAGLGPADHRVALLRFHVRPFDPQPLGPEVEIVERVLDVVARPDGIGGGAAPPHPVGEGEVGAVLDTPLALQRRIDDQAAAARDDRRSAGLRGHLEGGRPRAGFAGLDPRGHARAARSDDRHIGLETLDAHHPRPRPYVPGAGA